MMLPLGHPDLDSFLELAKSLSLKVEPNRATKSQVEIMDYTKYPESDIFGATYLEGNLLTPTFDGCVDLKSDGSAFAHIGNLEATRGQTFGSLTNLPHLIFIRNSVKVQLESACLKGLQLSLVPTDAADGEWPDGIEPLYLLSSTVKLPYVDMKTFNIKGDILAASDCDWSITEKWYPLDGYEVQPLLKYQYPLPDVDVALSRETFGGFGDGYRRIIYSQKTKTVLEEIGMKLDWVPVRIKNESPPESS